jgi:TPR repeat protein/S1-C subfamily serine protease
MKILNIKMVIIFLLVLVGCDEINHPNKDKKVASKVTPTKDLSPEEKFTKLQKEAEEGDPIAQFNLAMKYESGDGVPKDIAKAIEWYKKSSNQGNAAAQSNLGYIYYIGTDVSKNFPVAFDLIQKASAQNEPSAQFRLGIIYAYSTDIPKDNLKALEWIEKSATQGYVPAERRLGALYFSGDLGVYKDINKAMYWQEKAANDGNATDKEVLAHSFKTGLTVPKNILKAIEWYQKSADEGNTYAIYAIGGIYRDGKELPKDLGKAFDWFLKGANLGNADSQYSLGLMYEYGNGIPKDASKAFYWYQKSAAQGELMAQYEIGWKYFQGDGVPKDLILAYAWLNLAAAQTQDHPFVLVAKKDRDNIEKRLSAVERIEGQKLASNWKKGDNFQESNGSSHETQITKAKSTELTKQSSGTAFSVTHDGYALTNHHVINGCTAIKVAGHEEVVKVITSDSVNDLALLQRSSKTDDVAKLNPEPSKLRQGEDVIVFGYPLNFVLSSGGNLTLGTVSALTGLGNNTNQIQITAPIQPGSSGSPVLDKRGNVIAMVSMKLDDGKMAEATGQIGQNVNFAINGQTVRAFLDNNKVSYKNGGGFFSHDKDNADIADEARKWTMLVECWK